MQVNQGIDPKTLLRLTRKRISIDNLVDALIGEGAFGEIDADELVRDHFKRLTRRAIKSLKDDDGVPLIFSVFETGTDGREIRLYKQENLFNIEDYRQAIQQCQKHVGYWRKVERHLLKNARAKFGGQTEMFG